ncbi:universal stress protein [Pontibacter pudoricolor]|uniref:universal stress protein n=1 Tax=Pontibacter pudoricolor TaxID=2694930 RepID=UPI001391148E|nr:universal stress protein [Pontibacter pudoricolor]
MKTLLVPVDFSDNSVRALQYAIELATQAHAEVVVLHSLEIIPTLPTLDHNRETDEARQKLSALTSQVNKNRTQVRYIVTGGDTTGDIRKAIKELDVTMVVMGTGGAKNYAKKMFGTTTEAIAKLGLCPVLAIPEGADIKPIRQIVYAADFENGDQVTAMQLLQLKQLLNASLTFLHIHNKNQADYIDNEYIKQELTKQFPEAEINFVEIDAENVAEGISKYAYESDADLVAFTILNRMFFEKIIHSSVTSKLLKKLKLPMLALPENGQLLDLQKSDSIEMSSL